MRQRIQTAILAFIIFIPFVLIGGVTFRVFVFLLAAIAFIELIRMRKIGSYYIPVLLAIILLWLLMLNDPAAVLPGLGKSEIIMIFVLFLLAYTVMAKNKFAFDDAGFILLAFIYVGMGFFYLIETRDAGTNVQGLTNLLYVLLVIWATDTGAYFFGRAFGRRKLWPEISPNKTVEGAIGGVLLACVIGISFHMVHPFQNDMMVVVAVTVLVSVFGQIGDLVESAFKRYYGVKDSGNLLPGHGGILDRLDSLLFVLPILHFIQFFS
ncbi:phosphatidate cytidylyltransferase [Lentibacillus juripiscarius]|uniref:Phosphatidate cytidylyltransferase n=1 Tax=Lentibacillus juripiscarius TaxID=257446 RepID=A0ABW5V2Y8_9BACI